MDPDPTRIPVVLRCGAETISSGFRRTPANPIYKALRWNQSPPPFVS